MRRREQARQAAVQHDVRLARQLEDVAQTPGAAGGDGRDHLRRTAHLSMIRRTLKVSINQKVLDQSL